MSLECCEYETGDLQCFDLRPEMAEFEQFQDLPEYAEQLADPLNSWTFRDGDQVIACGGVSERWQGHGYAWAMIGPVPRRIWPALTRETIEVLDRLQQSRYHRLETHVDASFGAGARWVERLGFELEGYMRQYSHTGLDYLLYARIRDRV